MRPFLENVTRGRGIPPERLDDGRRALPAFRRRLTDQRHQPRADRAAGAELADAADLPVYFGNRNWEPYVEDAVAAMRDNGVRRAAVFTTSAWGGYSSCTQYVEDIARGRAAAGDRRTRTGQAAPVLRPSAVRRDVRRGDRRRGASLPDELRGDARLVFTAHSIPLAARSRCGPTSTRARSPTRRGWSRPRRATTITTRCGSRGRVRHRCRGWNPMSPTISSALADAGTKAVIVCPVGFVADHIEVVWDLDNELRQQADDPGIAFARAADPERRPPVRPAGGRS